MILKYSCVKNVEDAFLFHLTLFRFDLNFVIAISISATNLPNNCVDFIFLTKKIRNSEVLCYLE